MTQVAGQLPLALKLPQSVDLDVVRRQPTLTSALILCTSLAGFKNDKPLADKLDIDQGQWARIKAGGAHFPQEKFELLFDICGNEVPLIWLADRRGYSLVPHETEMERRLRGQTEENARLAAENVLLKGLVQGKAT